MEVERCRMGEFLRERSWEDESLSDVDELNDRFVENVKNAAVSQIGYVRTSARKRTGRPWWNDEIRDARKERKRLNRVCRQLRKRRLKVNTWMHGQHM